MILSVRLGNFFVALKTEPFASKPNRTFIFGFCKANFDILNPTNPNRTEFFYILIWFCPPLLDEQQGHV